MAKRKLPRMVPVGSRPYLDATHLPGCPSPKTVGLVAKGSTYSLVIRRAIEPFKNELLIFLDKIKAFYPDVRYVVVGVEEDLKTGKFYWVSNKWMPGAVEVKGRVQGLVRAVFKDKKHLVFDRRAHWAVFGLFNMKHATLRNLLKVGLNLSV